MKQYLFVPIAGTNSYEKVKPKGTATARSRKTKGDEKMTTKEIIKIREFALKLIRDEDTVQEILFEIIRRNLTLPLALNYVKLTAKGFAFRLNAKLTGKRKIDALNHASISIETTPPNAEECTIEETIPFNQDQINKIDFEIFLDTLNPQETKISELIIEGYSSREICKQLKISSKTYSKHIKSIRKKALEFFT